MQLLKLANLLIVTYRKYLLCSVNAGTYTCTHKYVYHSYTFATDIQQVTTLNSMATAIELSCREFIAESEGSESSPTHIISAKKFRFGFFRKISLTEEEANSITFVKIHQVVILICSILLMICLLQIPTILYYTNSPSFSSIGTFDIGIDVDFNACSVSHLFVLVHAGSVRYHVCINETTKEYVN